MKKEVLSNGIWGPLAKHIHQRASRETIRMSWTDRHATKDDLFKDRTTEMERKNKQVDELAKIRRLIGMRKQEACEITILAARQRTRVAFLMHTMMIKHRRILEN